MMFLNKHRIHFSKNTTISTFTSLWGGDGDGRNINCNAETVRFHHCNAKLHLHN